MTPPVRPETPPATPPASPPATPTPSSPPATPDPMQALLARIEAGETRQRQLEAQLAEARKPAAPPTPPRDLKAEQAAFFSDPTAKIQEAVAAAVKPINEQISTFRAQQDYLAIKAQYKRDPRFARWMGVIEPHLDAMAQQQNRYDNDFVATAVQALIGAATVGTLPGVTPPAPTPPNAPPAPGNGMIDPPHLRSSNPPQPEPLGNQPAKVVLTEQQRAMARRNKMSDEEYASWIPVPADQVIHHKFKPAGGNS